ncbi:SPFH domain-containing protein [Nocardia alni]|uniref:SPFH domain-containing protein n=1 Tax=Nocardia alni TaxID=2815723 RepID=UPI001C24386D|nr:SPFH domain-containing protein [Nocardia alni]
MAWFEREFIAVPEDRKSQLLYKWPDLNIRRFSRVNVNADEIALFVKSGRVVTALGPGRHRLDAEALPVLSSLIDSLTGSNYYRAELYFVSTRELPGNRFGGRLADIADPVSEQVVTLRAFGEYSLCVRDPAELITSLVGTADLSRADAVQSWSADLLLKSMKVIVTQGISRGDWPVLGLSAAVEPIEAAVLRQTNLVLYEYGLRIGRMGNFDITLAPEDADRLKRLAKDLTYIRLTGDFGRYAAGELALGAGQGLAHGGHGGDGGFLGAALGLNAIQQNVARPAVAEPTGTPCPRCHCANPSGARFCMHCGTEMTGAQPHHCADCGAELAPGAKFCTGCGAPTAQP